MLRSQRAVDGTGKVQNGKWKVLTSQPAPTYGGIKSKPRYARTGMYSVLFDLLRSNVFFRFFFVGRQARIVLRESKRFLRDSLLIKFRLLSRGGGCRSAKWNGFFATKGSVSLMQGRFTPQSARIPSRKHCTSPKMVWDTKERQLRRPKVNFLRWRGGWPPKRPRAHPGESK